MQGRLTKGSKKRLSDGLSIYNIFMSRFEERFGYVHLSYAIFCSLLEDKILLGKVRGFDERRRK